MNCSIIIRSITFSLGYLNMCKSRQPRNKNKILNHRSKSKLQTSKPTVQSSLNFDEKVTWLVTCDIYTLISALAREALSLSLGTWLLYSGNFVFIEFFAFWNGGLGSSRRYSQGLYLAKVIRFFICFVVFWQFSRKSPCCQKRAYRVYTLS